MPLSRRWRCGHIGGSGCIECFVSEQVGEGVDPRSCESEIYRGRVFPSSEPRTSRNAVEGASSVIHAWLGSVYLCRWSLSSISLGKFSGRGFLGGLYSS
jgi:hypothetical protein